MMEEAFHIYSNRVFINAYAWNINYALFSRALFFSVSVTAPSQGTTSFSS